MMRIFCFVALVALLVSGCGSTTPTQPTTVVSGSAAITNPVGGEIWKIGDEVTISWACTDCKGLPTGDYARVGVYNGVNTYLIIDNAGISDSKKWIVGTTLQNVSLTTGFYQIIVVDAGGTFQLVTPNLQIVNP